MGTAGGIHKTHTHEAHCTTICLLSPLLGLPLKLLANLPVL